MDLRVENVKRKDMEEVRNIYISSFSSKDRMPFLLMIILSKMKNTDFFSFYDGNMLCGFVYMATVNNLTFVMFLAVDERLRNKGYGSGILDKIQAMYPDKKILISIERCDEDTDDIDIRKKRKRFYIKNGYKETGYLIELGNAKQEILITNGKFDKEEFLLFFKQYSNGTIRPKIWSLH